MRVILSGGNNKYPYGRKLTENKNEMHPKYSECKCVVLHAHHIATIGDGRNGKKKRKKKSQKTQKEATTKNVCMEIACILFC